MTTFHGLPNGNLAHYDDATRAWWEVTRAQAARLAPMVEADPLDGYSLWCASTVSEQIEDYEAEDLGLWEVL